MQQRIDAETENGNLPLPEEWYQSCEPEPNLGKGTARSGTNPASRDQSMDRRRHLRFLAEVPSRAFAPVDIASLVFFRIAFGLLVFWTVWEAWSRDLIKHFWIDPPFLFKYYGFSWVHPWPGNGLYIHWFILGVLTLFVTAGFFYRVSAALFCLSYTYFFLLDQGRYVNHTYLICLFGFLLIFVPAHRAFSIDVWLRPRIRSRTTPAWSLWLLRAQMSVVYFFAGIAKISPDWLHGEPMRGGMYRYAVSPLLKHILHWRLTPYVASYSGLLFDLFIVPLLLWRRTRVAAFCVALCFHVLNTTMFHIDVFPWLAIAGTTIFLSPSWPRRVVSFFFRQPAARVPAAKIQMPPRPKRILILSFVTIYVAIQVLVPLRHFLYSGGVEWTYMEHRFSWQMMLRNQRSVAFYYVTDPNSGQIYQIRPQEYLDRGQMVHMGWHPDMIQQFARFLANIGPRTGPKPLEVELRMYVSVNGRRPQLFFDPNVDLVSAPRTWGRPPWLLQVHEPLPPAGKDFSNDFDPLGEGSE
jgi:vitamin K-dependent gamma-carboxylase